MPTTETLLRYLAPHALHPVPAGPEKLLVADSFLVAEGMARAPGKHAERFFHSCHTLGNIPKDTLRQFWILAMQEIPSKGQWFPRLELARTDKTPYLQIRLRPAPALQQTVRLINCAFPDKRTRPRHKGPDIVALSEKRKAILAAGAGEGIICTPSRYLLEGLFSSILWWENDTLCQTPPSKRVLPSVTAGIIREIALKTGIPFAWRFRRCHELAGCETWAVNALHGIRCAVNWERTPWHLPAQTTRDEWQDRLNRHALCPIHAASLP